MGKGGFLSRPFLVVCELILPVSVLSALSLTASLVVTESLAVRGGVAFYSELEMRGSVVVYLVGEASTCRLVGASA